MSNDHRHINRIGVIWASGRFICVFYIYYASTLTLTWHCDGIVRSLNTVQRYLLSVYTLSCNSCPFFLSSMLTLHTYNLSAKHMTQNKQDFPYKKKSRQQNWNSFIALRPHIHISKMFNGKKWPQITSFPDCSWCIKIHPNSYSFFDIKNWLRILAHTMLHRIRYAIVLLNRIFFACSLNTHLCSKSRFFIDWIRLISFALLIHCDRMKNDKWI